MYLKLLSLNNFATFTNQKIEFSPQFNAIVGETGSGKSLLMDAMQMVFGRKADKKLVRKGADFAVIEAIFSALDRDVHKFFSEAGYPFENNEIVIKRVLYPGGSSKSYLNFQRCNLNILSAFSQKFIDLVGQFENQKLLSENYQMQLLDSYASIAPLTAKYSKKYQAIQKLELDIKKLKQNNLMREHKQDYLKFQIEEIEKVDPSSAEEEELILNKNRVLIHEANLKSTNSILDLLSEGDHNVIQLLTKVGSELQNIAEQINPIIQQKIISTRENVEEIAYLLAKRVDDDVEVNISDIIDKLDQYQKLKRKFGGSIQEVRANLKIFKEDFANLKNIDETIEAVAAELAFLREDAWNLGEQIHNRRSQAAATLSQQLTSAVRKLMMSGATIKLELEKAKELLSNGITALNFIAETNPGESFHKIKDIASGGELSRILLAFRQILAANDSISLFLFDEIDSGIGGKTALLIGESLADVAQDSQVITITHLPQIATYADKLVQVNKSKIKERTVSTINEITGQKMSKILTDMAPLSS